MTPPFGVSALYNSFLTLGTVSMKGKTYGCDHSLTMPAFSAFNEIKEKNFYCIALCRKILVIFCVGPWCSDFGGRFSLVQSLYWLHDRWRLGTIT